MNKEIEEALQMLIELTERSATLKGENDALKAEIKHLKETIDKLIGKIK